MRKQETADEWLARHFANGHCDECGKGPEGHSVILVMNTFYARCDEWKTGGVAPAIRDRLMRPSGQVCTHGNFVGYCAACAGEE